MIKGPLEQAFKLAKKYRMNVSTVTELQKIISQELGHSKQIDDKVLTQILQLIENQKVYLREVR